MDTIQIRQKLHKLIEDAGQEKLEAFYEALCSIDKPAVFWWEDKNVLRDRILGRRKGSRLHLGRY